MIRLADLLTPNVAISRREVWLILGAWFVIWLTWWLAFRPAIFPPPQEILQALPTLWAEDGLAEELLRSLTVNAEALGVSVVVSLTLGYLGRVPSVTPLARATAYLRFLSPAVFYVLFLFVFSSSHALKVALLAIGEIFFLTRSLNGIINDPALDARLDDCRTLRMTEWEGTWYAIVRGTLPQVIDAIRDNAAMGWAGLLFVEGVVRSGGGVGVLLLNNERHLELASVYAIAGVILTAGIVQDWLIGQARAALCPWSK